MKVKKTSLNQLKKMYPHPSAHLFRAIELKTIYQKLHNKNFRSPSLDLGSGDGKIAKLLFTQRFTYGVDNGEANDYQESIENNIYGKVLLESAEKMSLPDKSVNFVFSNSVIEHIPGNTAVLREVSRILKRGGDFVFTSPSDQFRKYLYISHIFELMGLHGLSQWYSQIRNKHLNHYHLYSVEQWRSRLKKYNLKIVDHGYYIPKPALRLWDQMALLRLVLKIFGGKRADSALSKAFGSTIKHYYNKSAPHQDHGASLFIHAIKI